MRRMDKMIGIRIEKNKTGALILRAHIKEEFKDNSIIKRCLFDSKRLKGKTIYPYVIPLKYLNTIVNNLDKDMVKIHKNSILSFLEFSDEYDECYYYETEANVKYMKRWREVGCPKIYRVTLDIEKKEIDKSIAFQRMM
jgi:hypothetical protein